MKVAIWDLEYYYATNKTNCFNPDAMKISSYHKQCGDSVYLIETEDDSRRSYDIIYIIKEKMKTQGPPARFYLAPNVKWWGKAYAIKRNWKMSDVMLACRSDYQLYPQKQTREERSEHLRLLNSKQQLIELRQDWHNTYTKKYTLITDDMLWFSSKEIIIKALKSLMDVKNVSFLEPIWLQKIMYDKDVRELFLQLNFTSGSNIEWYGIKFYELDDAVDFINEFKARHKMVKAGNIVVDYRRKDRNHWENRNAALADFEDIKRTICRCKNEGFKFAIKMPENRFDTPYFLIFETIAEWTTKKFTISWLEFITQKYGRLKNMEDMQDYWIHPQKWNEVFRDLLRQTYIDKEFLTARYKGEILSANEIPYTIWDKEFKLGL